MIIFYNGNLDINRYFDLVTAKNDVLCIDLI